MKDKWFLLITTYASGVVVVNENRVVKTCPVYKRFMGKRWDRVVSYLKGKKWFTVAQEVN